MSDDTRRNTASTPPEEATTRVPSRRRRLLRRTLLVAALVILLTQLPFIYRAFQLRGLSRTLQELQAARVAPDSPFREYVGAFHVHTSLGGHSTGTLSDVIEAAQANRLDFVVMTEHTEGDYDTSALTLAGLRGDILFLPGNETQARSGSRFIVLPGAAETGEAGKMATLDFTNREQAAGRAVFVAYPDEFTEWNAASYDGIEVYNLYTNTRRANRLTLFFDSLWSYLGSPELIFARFYQRPAHALERWDALAAARAAPLAAVAGSDAHANIGIHLQLAGGERLFGIQLDPYERSFRIVRMHILLREGEQLTRETLLDALRAGRSFIAFDVFGNTTGFRFTATNGAALRTMGETIEATNETALRVQTPINSRIVLFRNGAQIGEATGTNVEFPAREPGAYRVEIYIAGIPLLADKAWIISNHIYVRGSDK